MRSTKNMVVLAITAVVLVGSLIAGICISPIAAVGLPAIVAAVALLIRAVAGDSAPPPPPPGPDEALPDVQSPVELGADSAPPAPVTNDVAPDDHEITDPSGSDSGT